MGVARGADRGAGAPVAVRRCAGRKRAAVTAGSKGATGRAQPIEGPGAYAGLAGSQATLPWTGSCTISGWRVISDPLALAGVVAVFVVARPPRAGAWSGPPSASWSSPAATPIISDPRTADRARPSACERGQRHELPNPLPIGPTETLSWASLRVEKGKGPQMQQVLLKPARGLEPRTPSLQVKSNVKTGVHGRSRKSTKPLQSTGNP